MADETLLAHQIVTPSRRSPTLNLLPPSNGRAEVRWVDAQEAIDAVGEEAVREQLLDEMDSLFRREVGATAPREWLTWSVSHSANGLRTEVLLTADAPLRSNRYFDARRQEVRTVPIAVTTESKIPIVPNSYRYADDNPFRRDDHVLTFKGWDAETGLMVFDR